MEPESETMEWKASWRNDWLKSIAAFASQNGGTLIIGKQDKTGKILGVSNSEQLLTEIPNTIRNKLGIIPSVREEVLDGLPCIIITIKREGHMVDLDGRFYIRSGSTTNTIFGEELRSMILYTEGISWTDLPTKKVKVSDLSKEALDFFVMEGIYSKRMSVKAKESSTESLLRNYDLMSDEGLLRSGAILFMEAPAAFFMASSVNIGEFSADNRLLRHDMVDCSAILQPDRVMDMLLNKYIRGVDDIVGMKRITIYPYPEKALREAVMNAIMHRDYSGTRQTYIRVYPDRIEVSNPGRLPHGWTEKDLMKKHDSVLINPSIAKAFFDIGFIEKWGSGIELMENECKAMNNPLPEYVMEKERVDVIFRLPEKKEKDVRVPIDISDLTERESKIFAMICDGNVTTIAEIAEVTGTSFNTAKRDVKKLVDQGYLQRIGSDKSGRWIPTSELN